MAPMAGAAPSAATQALPPQFETTCFAFNDTHFQARTAHRALRRGARRAAVRCVRALLLISIARCFWPVLLASADRDGRPAARRPVPAARAPQRR